MPLLEALPWKHVDAHSWARYVAMKKRYGLPDVPPQFRRSIPGMDHPELAASLEAEGAFLRHPIAPRKSYPGSRDLFNDEDASRAF
jgi:hypothetical protein